ncbi:hypothetical protein L0F63_005121 [Massospora cicadina]|nr:hypothetical protein L0F63_005121 [Massospora cicadina]
MLGVEGESIGRTATNLKVAGSIPALRTSIGVPVEGSYWRLVGLIIQKTLPMTYPEKSSPDQEMEKLSSTELALLRFRVDFFFLSLFR